jgi:hypothetical protein
VHLSLLVFPNYLLKYYLMLTLKIRTYAVAKHV